MNHVNIWVQSIPRKWNITYKALKVKFGTVLNQELEWSEKKDEVVKQKIRSISRGQIIERIRLYPIKINHYMVYSRHFEV